MCSVTWQRLPASPARVSQSYVNKTSAPSRHQLAAVMDKLHYIHLLAGPPRIHSGGWWRYLLLLRDRFQRLYVWKSFCWWDVGWLGRMLRNCARKILNPWRQFGCINYLFVQFCSMWADVHILSFSLIRYKVFYLSKHMTITLSKSHGRLLYNLSKLFGSRKVKEVLERKVQQMVYS